MEEPLVQPPARPPVRACVRGWLGPSAGAHLCCLVATDASYLAAVGLHPQVLNGVCGLSGAPPA